MIPKILLFLLPSLVFAGKVGENYLGAKIGQGTLGFSASGVGVEWDGFAFKLDANYNLISKDTYGIDVNLDFLSGSGLDGPVGTDSDISKFDGILKPFMKFSDITIFANIGFSSADWDIKNIGTEAKIDESTFAPGIGFEFSLDKLSIAPSLDWVDFDDQAKGTFVTIPASYLINDKLSLTAEFEFASFDSFTLGGSEYEFNYDSLMIGVDYNF